MINYTNTLKQIREKAPLVQCITNFVTVNDCANIILAAGASPSMASDIREVEEAVCGANALVCNLGAIEYVESMKLAGKKANALNIPVVLDPVAVGGTTLRKEMARQLLNEVHFDVIRGNASEIRSLAGEDTKGSGVDVSGYDKITKKNLNCAKEMLLQFAKKVGSVVIVSGELDLISNGKDIVVLQNGSKTMASITGSGCMLTALTGAFLGALPSEPFKAALVATSAMGICGEIAEEKRKEKRGGNATFRTDLIDAMFNLSEKDLEKGVCYV